MKCQKNCTYIRRYRRMVTCAVPKDYPDRKRLMKRVEQMLVHYQKEHADASYEDFIREFGAPEELAASLIDSLTGEQVLTLFHKRKKRGRCILGLAILFAFLIVSFLSWLAYVSTAVEATVTLYIYEESAPEGRN